MKEPTKHREKRCPVCEKEYPEEDNYCGDDGSVLERTLTTKHQSDTAGTSVPADDVNAEVNIVSQH